MSPLPSGSFNPISKTNQKKRYVPSAIAALIGHFSLAANFINAMVKKKEPNLKPTNQIPRKKPTIQTQIVITLWPAGSGAGRGVPRGRRIYRNGRCYGFVAGSMMIAKTTVSRTNWSFGCAAVPVLISLITARPAATNCIKARVSTEKPSDQGKNRAGAGQLCGSQRTQTGRARSLR